MAVKPLIMGLVAKKNAPLNLAEEMWGSEGRAGVPAPHKL